MKGSWWSVYFKQVHKLDNSTWQNVTVVPIDIADRSQVSAAVSRNLSDLMHSGLWFSASMWQLHVIALLHFIIYASFAYLGLLIIIHFLWHILRKWNNFVMVTKAFLMIIFFPFWKREHGDADLLIKRVITSKLEIDCTLPNIWKSRFYQTETDL